MRNKNGKEGKMRGFFRFSHFCMRKNPNRFSFLLTFAPRKTNSCARVLDMYQPFKRKKEMEIYAYHNLLSLPFGRYTFDQLLQIQGGSMRYVRPRFVTPALCDRCAIADLTAPGYVPEVYTGYVMLVVRADYDADDSVRNEMLLSAQRAICSMRPVRYLKVDAEHNRLWVVLRPMRVEEGYRDVRTHEDYVEVARLRAAELRPFLPGGTFVMRYYSTDTDFLAL